MREARRGRKRACAQFSQKPINNWKLIQIALGTSFFLLSLSFSRCPITNFQIAHINSIMIPYGLQFEWKIYLYLFPLSYVTMELHQPSKRWREKTTEPCNCKWERENHPEINMNRMQAPTKMFSIRWSRRRRRSNDDKIKNELKQNIPFTFFKLNFFHSLNYCCVFLARSLLHFPRFVHLK